jgi:hypothetical protein
MSDHIHDVTKMIGETPRMDVALRKAQEDCTESYLLTEGMKLERELNAANERIKRLEEAGDKMADLLRWQSRMDRKTSPSASAWRKAKEDKP